MNKILRRLSYFGTHILVGYLGVAMWCTYFFQPEVLGGGAQPAAPNVVYLVGAIVALVVHIILLLVQFRKPISEKISSLR